MITVITTRNTQGEIQNFACQLNSLEISLDVVSSIAGQGDQLLKVVLTDQGATTLLPLEVFDGQSFSKPIKRLEREWQLILCQQLNHEVPGNQRVANLID